VDTPVERRAGCFIRDGYRKKFIAHGETIDVFRDPATGAPRCTGSRYGCNDGDRTTSASSCSVTTIPFDCSATSDNRGCQKTISCPAGARAIGAVAAANLETDVLDQSSLRQVRPDTLRVVRPSDVMAQGHSFVHTTARSAGATAIKDLFGLPSVSVGCKEHDDNGGDCRIRGMLYCR
jgi:hypothetical protein